MVHVLTNGHIARVYSDIASLSKATGYGHSPLRRSKVEGTPLLDRAYKGWRVLSYPTIDEFLKHTDLNL